MRFPSRRQTLSLHGTLITLAGARAERRFEDMGGLGMDGIFRNRFRTGMTCGVRGAMTVSGRIHRGCRGDDNPSAPGGRGEVAASLGFIAGPFHFSFSHSDHHTGRLTSLRDRRSTGYKLWRV